MDCDGSDFNCRKSPAGPWQFKIYDYLKDNKQELETDYPFVGANKPT